MASGSVVVLAGPDGAGKSSLADELERDGAGHQAVVRIHHRPRVLPSRAAARLPTEEPHASKPYPHWLAIVKVGYLALDYVLGWLLRVRPATRRGDLVVLERGWWDLVVDPLRYRLENVDGLTRTLARVLPRPQLTVILGADSDVLLARKAELSRDELERQQAAWLAMSRTSDKTLVLDATRPVEALSSEVAERLSADERGRSTSRLVPISDPGGTTRWLIPGGRRRQARSGLRIYQPMSVRSRLAWEAARVLAIAGAFRLLPASAAAEPLEVLAPHIPAGGAAAIAEGRRDDRFVALIVDRAGTPVAVAKVALDDAGRACLRREVDALARFGALVTPPLAAPRILREDDATVLFEPVLWAPRQRPWDLPEAVAGSLGRFHAHRLEDGANSGHPIHGDCAPWNLLRTKRGWVLVDWEEARLGAHGFDDPFHYVLQASGHLGSPSTRAILDAVEGRGRLGATLVAFARAAEIRPSTLTAELERFLERSLPLLDPSNPPESRSLHARRRMLDVLRGVAAPDGRPRA